MTNNDSERRIQELEELVSKIRHDVRGALSPALLVADRLRMDQDPRVKRAGETIDRSITRVIDLLKATREIVPPRQQTAPAEPAVGAAEEKGTANGKPPRDPAR